MANSWFKQRIIGVVGNFLEHYDNALFGLLAPFIAPLFFEQKDPLTALILTYGMMPLGFITRPLGSLFFGMIGDRWGRRKALAYSLLGMTVATMSIGCLPVYKEIGIAAPILLAIGRMLQSFCAAGELAGGAIFVLEHTHEKKRGFASSCYDASTVAGILMASILVTFVTLQGQVEQHWRILFWGGAITAIVGFILRWTSAGEPEILSQRLTGGFRALGQYKSAFFAVIVASGLGHTTYSLAFTLMTGYIPLITSLSKTDVMQVNTGLFLVDLCLLPCFGYLSLKIGKERMMRMAAISLGICAIPLFLLLEGASLFQVICVRLVIIVLSIAFAAPYYAWAIEQVPKQHRYLLLSLGGALGSQLIGMPTSAICLWLYQIFGWSGVPGVYLVIVSFTAALIIKQNQGVKERDLTPHLGVPQSDSPALPEK